MANALLKSDLHANVCRVLASNRVVNAMATPILGECFIPTYWATMAAIPTNTPLDRIA